MEKILIEIMFLLLGIVVFLIVATLVAASLIVMLKLMNMFAHFINL